MATKPKASPHGAKLKKFLADPNKRATLPTKLLSPAQRKAREQNTRLNAPVVPGSSLTNRALKQETNAAVTEKYAPAEAALNSQLGQAKSFQAAQPTYYDRYQAELRAAASAQRAAGAQLQSELGNIFGGAASANQGAMDSANSQAQASAAQRGATVDPGVAQRGAQAAGVGNNLNASFAALAASQGAAQQGGLTNQAEVVAPLAKFAAGVQAQKGTQSVMDQLSALGQQKGAFATDYKGQRLTDEQKNLIANQALGLNVTKANTTAALGKSNLDLKTKALSDKEKSDAYDRTHKLGKYAPKTPPKPKSNLLPGGSQTTLRDNYQSAIAYIADNPISPAQRNAAISHLTNGAKGEAGKPIFDPKTGKKVLNPDGTAKTTSGSGGIPKVGGLAARAAVEQSLDGHISRGTQKRLQDAGYSVKQLGLTTFAEWQKHGKKPGASAASSAVQSVVNALPGG